jgi:FkbM family methyltransferase
MSMNFKKLAALLPDSAQHAMRRQRYRKQIEAGSFRTPEPEWDEAARWIQLGDWVVDVGANIGHYTVRFSELVGAAGRVVSFEPVPDTFELLAANVLACGRANVTMINAAATEQTTCFGMNVPRFSSGLANYYEASISRDGTGIQVMGLSLDGLSLPQPVRLIKVDAEGHDLNVLRGAAQLIARDRPLIIIESGLPEVKQFLQAFGYEDSCLPNSPNRIYRCAPG